MDASLFMYHSVEPDEWRERMQPYNDFVDAIRSGSLPRVRHFLQSGGVSSSTVPGRPLPPTNPPIIVAILAGNQPITAELLDADPGAATESRDVDFGGSALHWAAAGGDEDAVRALLLLGADVNARSWEGFTPVHAAAAYGHAGVLGLLLQHGGSATATTLSNETPLHLAAEKGHAASVAALLGHGADPVALDRERCSPLMRAAVCNQQRTMLPLLSCAVDVHVRDSATGRTTLHWAAHHGDERVAVALLGMAAVEINAIDRRQDTPLHLAACRGHRTVAEALLRRGAQLDPVNAGGVTPLLSAAFFGHAPVVELLLIRGANMRLVDSTHRRTALHWAAANDDAHILQLLLNSHVEHRAVDAGGLSALDLAMENESTRALAVLRTMS